MSPKDHYSKSATCKVAMKNEPVLLAANTICDLTYIQMGGLEVVGGNVLLLSTALIHVQLMRYTMAMNYALFPL